MPMSEANLAQKIIEVMQDIRVEETDPDNSMNIFAQKLATAIVTEVKKMTIVATAPNGAVTIVSIN